jgi:hypothetical protein
MCESVNDVRYIVQRTVELIEQSQIMRRELDIHGTEGGRISSKRTSATCSLSTGNPGILK